MANSEKSKYAPFWVIVIALLLILGVLVMFSDVFTGSDPAPEEPLPTSTEWAPAPEGGVDVAIPETPMRNVQDSLPDAPAEDAQTGAE